MNHVLMRYSAECVEDSESEAGARTSKIRHLGDALILTRLVRYPRDVARGRVFALRSAPLGATG